MSPSETPQFGVWANVPAAAQAGGAATVFPAHSPFAFERSEANNKPLAGLRLPASSAPPRITANQPGDGGLLPVNYNDAIRKRPWWSPPGFVDLWLDQSIKGGEGLINFFRSHGSSRRDRKEECDRRWEMEDQRCYARRQNMPADYLDGCRKRAMQRYKTCLRNGLSRWAWGNA
jgi:hypothetical protein